jgi:opacity protein-like surface antigen
MKARLCAVLVCAFAIAVIAQTVDGKWSGEVQGGRGPQQVNLTLKADGGNLSGTVAGRGGEIPIQEGTISGNALKFKTKQQGRGGNEITLNWNGTLKGDEIAMSRMAEGGQGQAQDFVLKRQK